MSTTYVNNLIKSCEQIIQFFAALCKERSINGSDEYNWWGGNDILRSLKL